MIYSTVKLNKRKLNKIIFASKFVFLNYSAAAISMFITIVVANFLGPSEYGIYSYGLTFATICMTLSMFGSDKSLVRDIIQSVDPKATFTASLIIRSIFSIAITVLLITWLYFSKKNTDLFLPTTICIVSGILLSLTPKEWLDSQNLMSVHASIELLDRLFFLFFLATFFLFIKLPGSATIIAISLLFSRIITFVYQWYYVLTKFKPISYKWNNEIKYILNQNYSVWFASIGNLMMTHFSLIILEMRTNSSELGLFNIAFRFIFVIRLFQQQIMRLLRPGIARITDVNQSNTNINKQYLSKIKISLYLTAIVIIPYYFIGPFLINIFLNPSYINSIPSFKVLLLWSMVFGPSIVNNQFLLGLRLNTHYMIVAILCGMISLMLSWVLVPHFGALGAALSLLVSHSLSIITQYLIVAHVLKASQRKFNSKDAN